MDKMRAISEPTIDPVEDAFRSYPMEPVPGELYARIIRGVKQTSPSVPQVVRPFQLFSWLDVAISLFLSIMFGMILFIGRIIPSEMIPSFKWVLRMIGHPLVIIPLVIGFIMVGIGLLITSRLLHIQSNLRTQ